MPRFIVERDHPAAPLAAPQVSDGVRLTRSFSMGGRTFDVYVAADRFTFRRFAQRLGLSALRTYE